MAAECICTGFALVNNYGTWWPADLFKVGNVYVVNASGEGLTQAISYNKQATFDESGHHFERRNVFVFTSEELEMNQAMKDYIGGELL